VASRRCALTIDRTRERTTRPAITTWHVKHDAGEFTDDSARRPGLLDAVAPAILAAAATQVSTVESVGATVVVGAVDSTVTSPPVAIVAA
jgi:hypothetical protein